MDSERRLIQVRSRHEAFDAGTYQYKDMGLSFQYGQESGYRSRL